MKKINIKSLLLIVVVLLAFSSCEDWLDVQPSTQLDREKLFKSEDGYSLALTGVYSGMTSTSLYGKEMTYGTLDVLTAYYKLNMGTYYKFATKYPYKREDSDKDVDCIAIIDAMWSGLYKQIANLNSILATIDSKKSIFSDDNYRIIKGETVGLRAFIHFDLLRMYGPSYAVDPSKECIPIVDTLTTLITPLSTVEEACDKIIADLKRALILMENDPIRLGQAPSSILASGVASANLPSWHNRKYHFNYYAVKATLARAYLWKNDKINALKYAKELIDEQSTRFPWVLDANLTSIIDATKSNKDRTFTTEHIFALNINSLEQYVPLNFSSAGASSSANQFYNTKTFFKTTIYEDNTTDPRYLYLFNDYGTNQFPSKLYQNKEADIWFKNQIPLIRITEMYYIAAECEPNVADGAAWLNIVRHARNLASLTITTDAQMKTALQKEYRKEFICEGQLWYFYKRKNYSSLPNTWYFYDTEKYVFDLPEDEYVYGGRE